MLERQAADAQASERAEEALRQTRAKYQAFIDSGHSSDASVFVGAVKACDEIAALAAAGAGTGEET